MHIRIISGKYKGRRITAPKKLPVRPTTDRAKEALFNILENKLHIPSLKVLDLFTGTGSISYEFASRGAQSIHAVDRNYFVLKFVKKTIKEFDFPIKIFQYDVLKFLLKTDEKYDIVFADPPYDMEIESQKKMIEHIFNKKILNQNGLFILEHKKHLDFSDIEGFVQSRKYGISVFSFFKNSTNILES